MITPEWIIAIVTGLNFLANVVVGFRIRDWAENRFATEAQCKERNQAISERVARAGW